MTIENLAGTGFYGQFLSRKGSAKMGQVHGTQLIYGAKSKELAEQCFKVWFFPPLFSSLFFRSFFFRPVNRSILPPVNRSILPLPHLGFGQG